MAYKEFVARNWRQLLRQISRCSGETGLDDEALKVFPIINEITLEFCCRTNWYLGLDRQGDARQCDLVEYARHEFHHGLGWIVPWFLFVIEPGRNPRADRSPGIRIFGFERYISFFNKDGGYCPISALFPVPEDTQNEQVSKQERLARVLTSNQLYFVTGEKSVKPHSPSTFDDGVSLIHTDKSYGMEDRIMAPNLTYGETFHTIGPKTSLVLHTLRDPTIDAPSPCTADTEPADDDPDAVSIPFGHQSNKSGSTVSIDDNGNQGNDPGMSHIKTALEEVSNTFSKVLRFDAKFWRRCLRLLS